MMKLIPKTLTFLGKVLLGALVFMLGTPLIFGSKLFERDLDRPGWPVDFIYRNPNQSINPADLPHPYTDFNLLKYNNLEKYPAFFSPVFRYNEEGRAYVEALSVENETAVLPSQHIYRFPVMWEDRSLIDGGEEWAKPQCVTCGENNGTFETRNTYPDYTPDGNYVIFISNRHRGTGITAPLTCGELYLVGVDGSNPTRLTNTTETGLGCIRVPQVHPAFIDGEPTVGWTQVSPNGVMRLFYTKLVDREMNPSEPCFYDDPMKPEVLRGSSTRPGVARGGTRALPSQKTAKYCLSADVRELRIGYKDENESPEALARSRAWKEWHFYTPGLGDWWGVSTTLDSMLNVDMFFVSYHRQEARRVTQNRGDQEVCILDPSGLGMFCQEGPEEQVARVIPEPLPSFFDSFLIGFAILFIQTHRAGDWTSDAVYHDYLKRQSKIVGGKEKGYMVGPGPYIELTDCQTFGLFRSGWANSDPDPDQWTWERGCIVLEGDPEQVYTREGIFPRGEAPNNVIPLILTRDDFEIWPTTEVSIQEIETDPEPLRLTFTPDIPANPGDRFPINPGGRMNIILNTVLTETAIYSDSYVEFYEFPFKECTITGRMDFTYETKDMEILGYPIASIPDFNLDTSDLEGHLGQPLLLNCDGIEKKVTMDWSIYRGLKTTLDMPSTTQYKTHLNLPLCYLIEVVAGINIPDVLEPFLGCE
ncbi:MAG: hypothetical protein HY538_01035 [Deltaproteobacteria bacterium]|nr:hypothetical protein [Deltaproteobacteria bacterium]